MGQFSWLGSSKTPPIDWDLRRCGWVLRDDLSGLHPLLCDKDHLPMPSYSSRTVVVDVAGSADRAALIGSGFADALAAQIGIDELAWRIGSRQISAELPGTPAFFGRVLFAARRSSNG